MVQINGSLSLSRLEDRPMKNGLKHFNTFKVKTKKMFTADDTIKKMTVIYLAGTAGASGLYASSLGDI